MTALEHSCRYAADSALRDIAGGHVLFLASDLGQAPDRAGPFLTARALYPMENARGLRAVSEIVGSRFYVPPAMLARILAKADPVATFSPGTVRFEGLSACCGTYIRLDLDDAAIDVSARRNGTTNVDFGPELRGAISSVAKGNRLDLTIGADAVAIAKNGHEIIERKVPLPLRWLKGFAEVQIILAGMEPAFRLPRVAAQRFLRQFPRGKSDHLQWVSAVTGQARLSARETPGAVPLRGAHRLRVLETLAPMAAAMEVHVNRTTGASAWTLDLGTQRLCLVLNAEPWRGFSGDGGLLSRLAASGDAAMRALRAQLHWQDRIEADSLAKATGLGPEAVQIGLAQLAATGLIGFDLTRGGYFHRVLPFQMDRIEALNPRLKAARKLLDAATFAAAIKPFLMSHALPTPRWSEGLAAIADAGHGTFARDVILDLLDFTPECAPRDMGAMLELLFQLCLAAGTAPTRPEAIACLTAIPGGGKVARFSKKLVQLVNQSVA